MLTRAAIDSPTSRADRWMSEIARASPSIGRHRDRLGRDVRAAFDVARERTARALARRHARHRGRAPSRRPPPRGIRPCRSGTARPSRARGRARCRRPRRSRPGGCRPRESRPAPMPEPTLQKIRSSDSSWRRARSLKASRLTSLSTQVGASNRCSKRRRTSKPFQPGMIGGATGRPLSKSTGPGTPTAMPQTGTSGWRARISSSISSAFSIVSAGPRAMSHSWWL